MVRVIVRNDLPGGCVAHMVMHDSPQVWLNGAHPEAWSDAMARLGLSDQPLPKMPQRQEDSDRSAS